MGPSLSKFHIHFLETVEKHMDLLNKAILPKLSTLKFCLQLGDLFEVMGEFKCSLSHTCHPPET
jgi:hypothetical protein